MDEYLGIVKIFAGNFAPRGWAFCDGSLLNIAQNSALFSLIGTYYGGNGSTTFALPDLRGRVAVGVGNGPNLTPVVIGQKAGANDVTLTTAQLPPHAHNAQLSTGAATTATPAAGLASAAVAATVQDTGDAVSAKAYGPATNLVPGAPSTPAGSGQPLSVMQPYLGVNYIICISGLYPSRN